MCRILQDYRLNLAKIHACNTTKQVEESMQTPNHSTLTNKPAYFMCHSPSTEGDSSSDSLIFVKPNCSLTFYNVLTQYSIRASCVQSTLQQPSSVPYILILHIHLRLGIPCVSFPSIFSTKCYITIPSLLYE